MRITVLKTIQNVWFDHVIRNAQGMFLPWLVLNHILYCNCGYTDYAKGNARQMMLFVETQIFLKLQLIFLCTVLLLLCRPLLDVYYKHSTGRTILILYVFILLSLFFKGFFKNWFYTCSVTHASTDVIVKGCPVLHLLRCEDGYNNLLLGTSTVVRKQTRTSPTSRGTV